MASKTIAKKRRPIVKKILIIGAGTAGTMMAIRLSRKMNLNDWSITILDKDENHYYQPGYLFIPFGLYTRKDVVRKGAKYIPVGVEYILAEAEQIVAEQNRVKLKDGREMNYDILIIATGTSIHPEETEGMLENGWRENIFDVYTAEGVYPPLIMANGARMEGIEANLFFTFFGMDAITKKKYKKIKVDTVGNPAMVIPTLIGALPGMSALATMMMKKKMDALDIPPVDEFIKMISAAGCKLYACKASVDMFGLKREDFVDDVQGVITVGEFYALAAGGQIIFT